MNIAYLHFLVISLYRNYYFPFCLESLVGSISKVLGVCGVGDREVRVSPGCEAEVPICSVAITNLSGVGSDSKLLEQKSWRLGSSRLYSFYMCFFLSLQDLWGLFFFCHFIQRLSWKMLYLKMHSSEQQPSRSLQTINAGEGAEKKEPSYTVGGNAN